MSVAVSAIRTKSYDPALLDRAVETHFLALDIPARLKPETKVLLKPNLLMRRAPRQATTTHPEIVAAVARRLQALGVKDITLADSPGGPYTKAALESIYRTTGMAGVAEQCGIKLNYDTGHKTVTCCSLDGLCHTFDIINPVSDADFIINLPKLKTHAMTTLSCGVKNLFGVIPGLMKPELHFRFPQRELFARMLVELSGTVRPGLTLVDAVVSMEGDGPSGGDPRETGWTLASDDPAGLDLAACRFMGLDPAEVYTVAYSQSIGACPPSFDDIVYLGEEPTLERPFKLPRSREVNFTGHVPGPFKGLVEYVGQKWLAPRPVVVQKGCIGCGKCAESCPANTVSMEGGKARIREKDCIRCYCCHEMCPVRTIEIRRRKLLGW